MVSLTTKLIHYNYMKLYVVNHLILVGEKEKKYKFDKCDLEIKIKQLLRYI